MNYVPLLLNLPAFVALLLTRFKTRVGCLSEKEAAEVLGYTQASWDNHAAAFGAMDVDKILLDYTEDSVIIVSDFTSGVAQTVGCGTAEDVTACLRDVDATALTQAIFSQPGAFFGLPPIGPVIEEQTLP